MNCLAIQLFRGGDVIFHDSWLGYHHRSLTNFETYYVMYYIDLTDILQEKMLYSRCILYYQQMRLISVLRIS